MFLLPLAPRHRAFSLSLSSTKSALLAEPLQAVLTTLDNIWLKGKSYRLQGWEKWESSSGPSHLTLVLGENALGRSR